MRLERRIRRVWQELHRLFREIENFSLIWRFRKIFRGGMGAHPEELLALLRAAEEFSDIHIVEFGSGGSTEFFEKVFLPRFKRSSLTSFDHDARFAHSTTKNTTRLHIRGLLSYSDNEFERAFREKTAPRNGKPVVKPGFRDRNTFYDILNGDLPRRANVVFLDGPNGNGRSISFLYLKEILEPNSLILIDDVHHHDFEDRLLQAFKSTQLLAYKRDQSIHTLYSWALYKVTP